MRTGRWLRRALLYASRRCESQPVMVPGTYWYRIGMKSYDFQDSQYVAATSAGTPTAVATSTLA